MLVVGDIIRNNARHHPDKTGLIHDGNRFTWKETEGRVNALAQGLIGLGLKKNDAVGILLRNCHQWVEAAFALAKLGLRMVPLNLRLTAGELSYIINDADVQLLIVDGEKADLIEGMIPELSGVTTVIGCHGGHGFTHDFEQLISSNPEKDPSWPVSSTDISVLIYTSGTTGHPKGAMLTHGNLMAAAICEGYEYRLIPSHVTMTFIPLFFIGGWGSTCLPYLLRGCTHHILSFEPERILKSFQDDKINCTLMVPTMINRLTHHPHASRYDYSSLKTIPFAGSALPIEHWRNAVSVFGDVFVSVYGFTEGCGTVSVLQPEAVDTSADDEDDPRMASCGKAMVQTAMKLNDNDGNEIPLKSDEIGEICVKGPTVFKGYWRLPETTQEVLKDGWFKTGDLARRDEEGFYYIVDRKKDMIISGDINIYPREIEEVIHTHPAVMDCSVIGVPDERWGETVKAIVTLKERKSATAEELIEWCRQRLASFKKPTSVDFISDMPRTASGKILKRKLRESYWQNVEQRNSQS